MPHSRQPRRVCFVTGTRAEFGLMATTLRAMQHSPRLRLQLIATGMHLDPAHGDGVESIRAAGHAPDRLVPWPRGDSAATTAAATGRAMAGLAQAFAELGTEIVLVAGDRVEAFAATAAAAVSGLIVAHVHGGDRALGQVDDSLRHAITKLAHLHFPATLQSARRLRMLGEDPWRIHRVGSPGIDGIASAATPFPELRAAFPALSRRRFALLSLHPTSPDAAIEEHRAAMLLNATLASGVDQVVVIGPNNDPGCEGILRRWAAIPRGRDAGPVFYRPDLPRARFLGLLRDAAFVIGNSSSGIIEAASFGTAVIDVGDRQRGRERGRNVRSAAFAELQIRRAIAKVWRAGQPVRFPRRNIYGGGAVGRKIAAVLRAVPLDDRLRRKLIAY